MLDKSQLSPSLQASTLSSEEIEKFDRLAENWWDPKGRFKTALAFNACRVALILQQVAQHYQRDRAQANSLQGLSVLDVGCGAGLICEPFAAQGAKVTGIDASAVSIEVAKRHALSQGLAIDYRHCLAESLSEQQGSFDIVINAEVVEHVPDQATLIKQCASLVKPGGLLFLATLNRTLKSFVIAIVGAEYVMGYLPRGTHDWRLFVKPEELSAWVGQDFSLHMQSGVRLNPLTGIWSPCASLQVNYLQCYQRSPIV